MTADTPVPPDDADLKKLLADVAEDWARLPADESGDELALAFGRAAYALGYVRALESG